MYPVYKRVKHLAPHCPQCGEELQGDNSCVSPWTCNCGTWKNDFINPMDYKIVGDKKE